MDPDEPRTMMPDGRTAKGWVIRTFRGHAIAVLGFNAVLNIVNALAGGSWWAFWPLLVTGVAFAIHYLLYRAASVDARWVDERVEELNLKSYDRSHIEDLKSRYGEDATDDRKRPP